MESFAHISLNALDVFGRCNGFRDAGRLHRPGPEQRLVEQIFFVSVGRFGFVDNAFPAAIGETPALQGAPPKFRQFGNGNHPRAHIFAAFCVVRRGREQCRRPIALPIQVALVKCVNA